MTHLVKNHSMNALRIYAGPIAQQHIAQHGLLPQHIHTIPGAAGGPKGLVLGPLDRFIFGQWLPQSAQHVHLVGASIGAWRMATACLNESVAGFERLEYDYIRQHYELASGQKRPTARHVSERFGESLQSFYGGRVAQVLDHTRFHLHIITSRGRHVLAREQALRTPLGYLGAFMSNAVRRKAMGAWLERVVFSSPRADGMAQLPFGVADYRTRQVRLSAANFFPALQASCSIPFVLQAVHNIPGAPPGAYWDGGLTDYHLHLNYTAPNDAPGIVLYPHFQQAVVPGWLDKGLKWRHKATGFLDRMVVLAPNPEWVKKLPNGKLPDRTDFTYYGTDLAARVKAWSAAVSASHELAEEFALWLREPDVGQIQHL
jgi:hypothetical protein